MRKENGKLTFMGFIFFLLIVFGAFLAFQYLKTSITKKEIKREIYDMVGNLRSSGNMDSIRSEIKAILERKGATLIKASVSIERAGIVFRYIYEIETNYIFTIKKEQVDIAEQMAAY